jgi:TonB family protein
MKGELIAANQGMRLKSAAASVLVHALVLAVFVPLDQADSQDRNSPRDEEVIEVVLMDENAMTLPREEIAEILTRPRLSIPAAKTPELKRPDAGADREADATESQNAQDSPIPDAVEVRDNPPLRQEPQKGDPPSRAEGVATTINEPISEGFAVESVTRPIAVGASSGESAVGSLPHGTKGYGSGGPGEGTGDGSNIPRFGSPAGPRFLKRKMPEYPFAARKQKKEGKVVLALTVDMNGCLRHVEVLEATDPLFVPPSIAALEKSSFLPAIRNGTPVTVKAILPIRFALSD